MEDPESSVNMTLVGLALKAQKPGQTFNAAAMKILERHFPEIPRDVLIERVVNLENSKNQMTVAKYGNVITMKPISDNSTMDISSLNTPQTPSIRKVKRPEFTDFAPRTCLPENILTQDFRSPEASKCGLMDDIRDSPFATPNSITCPRKRPHLWNNHNPVTPKSKAKQLKAKSPQTAIKHSPRKGSKTKVPATVPPLLKPTGYVDASPLCPPTAPSPSNSSPIKTVLTNRATKLRRETNLAKIGSLGSPRPGLDFNMSPLPQCQTFTAKNSPSGLGKSSTRGAPVRMKNHLQPIHGNLPEKCLPECREPKSLSHASLHRALKDVQVASLNYTPLKCLSDECIKAKERQKRTVMESENYPSPDDLQEYINKPSFSHTGFTTPQLSSGTPSSKHLQPRCINSEKSMSSNNNARLLNPDSRMTNRNAKTKTEFLAEATRKAAGGKIEGPPSKDGDDAPTRSTKQEGTILGEEVSKPTTLTLSIGTGGLVINIQCSGDLVIE